MLKVEERIHSLRFIGRGGDGAFFVNDPSYRKKEQQSLPRFKHIGRGLLSAGCAAFCLDGDCADGDICALSAAAQSVTASSCASGRESGPGSLSPLQQQIERPKVAPWRAIWV